MLGLEFLNQKVCDRDSMNPLTYELLPEIAMHLAEMVMSLARMSTISSDVEGGTTKYETRARSDAQFHTPPREPSCLRAFDPSCLPTGIPDYPPVRSTDFPRGDHVAIQAKTEAAWQPHLRSAAYLFTRKDSSEPSVPLKCI